MWSVPAEWQGETAFIVCGGPSVAHENIAALRGRRVIVINSSYRLVPWADILFFGDARWWGLHKPHLGLFEGRIVTCASGVVGRVLKLYRMDTKFGLSMQRDSVVMGRTSLQGALNLAFLLGCPRMVVIGADMGPDEGGRTHHHEPHPWPQRPTCWDDQMAHLAPMAAALASLGVEVVNTSPVSRLPFWPKARLADCL